MGKIMIFVNDTGGHTIYAGPEWVDLTGQVADDSLGQKWMDKIHTDDRALIEDVRSRAIETTNSYTLQFRLMKPDGSYRWVTSGAKPSFGRPDQDFLGFNGFVTALTGNQDNMNAFGHVGHFFLEDDVNYRATDDHLDRIAHHVIAATSLIQQCGLDAAIPGAHNVLFHVARAIASRQDRSNKIH